MTSLNSPSNTGMTDAVCVQQEFCSPAVKNFSLYEELSFTIKSLLISARKGVQIVVYQCHLTQSILMV